MGTLLQAEVAAVVTARYSHGGRRVATLSGDACRFPVLGGLSVPGRFSVVGGFLAARFAGWRGADRRRALAPPYEDARRRRPPAAGRDLTRHGTAKARRP